jgi:hypothetical protein
MDKLRMWFLDVGHGDCTYVHLPNGSNMMIDCGCGPNHWPSTVLCHFGITKAKCPAPIPGVTAAYALDKLLISHPHGDHLADIRRIKQLIGFYLFVGDYGGIIDQLTLEDVDFRRRDRDAAEVFFDVVREYQGVYEGKKDRVVHARAREPACVVDSARFLPYTKGMDLNELSWFTSFTFAGHKVLFTGDMTAAGVRRILASPHAEDFRAFVRGTSILKVPHHGRDDGCSQEMLDLFGRKPIACIASDEVLKERNEGTSNMDWYGARTTDEPISVDGSRQSGKVFTTRNDKDIFLSIGANGTVSFETNVFAQLRAEIEIHSLTEAL